MHCNVFHCGLSNEKNIGIGNRQCGMKNIGIESNLIGQALDIIQQFYDTLLK